VSELTQILFGTKELVIKPPVIEKKIIPRKFWFNKIEYWIVFEYVAMGPYKSHSQAYEVMLMMNAHTK